MRETYGANEGWTTCLWHPAVRAANRETRRQFTEVYPVDILFQDDETPPGAREASRPPQYGQDLEPDIADEYLLPLKEPRSHDVPLAAGRHAAHERLDALNH